MTDVPLGFQADLERQVVDQDEDHATQPFVNNIFAGSSSLMTARSCSGYLMVMHETRIFYFSCNSNNDNAQIHSFAETADYFAQLILRLLMTRKYRLLSSFYSFWHILDYTMITALVLILFFGEDPKQFHEVMVDHKWIFLVVAIEVFYTVLESQVKIWILNRVSIHIGCIISCLYLIALWSVLYGDALVTALFVARVGAFIFSTILDFCIDLELHRDLKEKAINKLEIPMCLKTKEEHIAVLHVGNHNEIQFPAGWDWAGSVCAWSCENAFRLNPNRAKEINKCCYELVFQFMFIVTYCIIGIPLLLFTTLSVGLLSCFRRCCGGNWKNTICDECRHRYSY